MQKYLELAFPFKALFIGSMGGIVHYIFEVTKKGTSFRWAQFWSNMLVASFTGWLAGEFLTQAGIPYRDGFVAIAGVSGMEIMILLEKKSHKLFTKLNDLL